jgi:ketosteroid isomerase-like protein
LTGNVQGATEAWADDVVWRGPTPSTEMPGGGEHAGKDAALKTLGNLLGSWDDFTLHMEEFFEDGNTVVALGHAHLRKGEEEAQTAVVHVLRIEDGKVKHIQAFADTLPGQKLLGLV